MNQLCRVCSEPAAGFHFGAFTCEGCKSFFGRTCNNVSSLGECKNGSKCVITRKNRTTCKSCRLNKCLQVGMSKSGSRYGRRSNWFKIHCLMQEPSQCESSSATEADASPQDLSENKSETKQESDLDQERPAGTSSPYISSSESRVPTEDFNILEFVSEARSKVLQRSDWFANGLEASQASEMLRTLTTISPFLVASMHGNQISEMSRYYSFLSLLAQSNQSALQIADKTDSESAIYGKDTPPVRDSSSPEQIPRLSVKRKAEDTLEKHRKVPKTTDSTEQNEPIDLSVKRSKQSDSILSCSMTLTKINPYENFKSVAPTLKELPSEGDSKAEVDICSG